ncbi:MAG: DUF2934 domain-containing protein [Gammaproteobacteria bacterium]|nr:DUF2934 domain-containing protein [Gammaproteobacteria bacterium]NNJ85324.1 DUF2934 domain-containing protein [Gammaproteobacteria bacterium]
MLMVQSRKPAAGMSADSEKKNWEIRRVIEGTYKGDLAGNEAAGEPDREMFASDAITPEERWNMIAVAAYYRAEQRGFIGGSPAEDWIAAEEEIDSLLSGNK